MKTEHTKHLGEFKQLHDKALLMRKAKFGFTCDAEEIISALEQLAELRHEKSQGWAASALRKRYEVNVQPLSGLSGQNKGARMAPAISLMVYPE